MTLCKALSECEKSITASINALHPLDTPSPTADLTLPDLPPGLATSFTTILQQLRQTTTSVSLSFKPPISTDAAIAKLKSLHEQYGQLASCVVLASGGKVGVKDSYIVREWRDGILDIGTQLLSLLVVLNEAEQNSGESSKGENPYLAHTGMVWDAIDRLHGECSASEVDAVRKVWKGQSGIMRDAWEEFKEILEDAEEEDGQDDFVDDSEEIFGPGASGTLSPGERQRAQTLKPILSLYFLLHSSLLRYLQNLVLEPDRPYTSLVTTGDELVSAFDDAVSAVSPPQDSGSIQSSLEENLATTSNGLIQLVKARIESSSSDGSGCLTFLDKWQAKMGQELQAWQDQSMSLKGLKKALDA